MDASNSTTSLDAVRFLIAAHRKGLPDADRNGFVDPVDAMPNDAEEWWDTDGDGTGDNADLDDDNDGRNDVIDAFPRDASKTRDTDGDGVGNNADPFPEMRAKRPTATAWATTPTPFPKTPTNLSIAMVTA